MALKLVYKICCSIDVHKTFVVACIASTDKQGVTSYESHRFSTYTKGLKDLLQWLLARNCKDVCMESTGKYWIPIFNILEKECSIVLAHPKYVKAIRGKNRLQNCLTVSNIQLGNVVSDTFGKSAQAILDKILENPEDTSFDLEPLVFKGLKKKLPELRDAIDGYITSEQAGKLKVIKAHYENLESRKAELEELILALAAPYQQELAILQTAPGISSDFTAIGIISEIGTNMEAFPSAKHLCSWAGLTPTNNESAGKKKSVRVSKAGCYIKPLLVQCANAVVKSSKHPEMRNRYLRIKKRRGHKKAIIAIARMLLTALYHMLKDGESYNAELICLRLTVRSR